MNLEVSAPSCDTASEMMEAAEEAAFPNVHAVRRTWGREDEPSDEELREGAKADLQVMVKASWQRQHLERSTDPNAALARMMGAPLKLVKQWRRMFEGTPGPERQPPKPKRPRKRHKR